MLKNILIGIIAAALVVAGGTAFYNVIVVDAAGSDLFGNWFGPDDEVLKVNALEAMPISEVSEQEKADLAYLAEAYRMASDLEEYAVNKWTLNEYRQMLETRTELEGQFDILRSRYPFESGEAGFYSELSIQSGFELGKALIDQDKASAYMGLAYVAELQIQALSEKIGATNNADIRFVYQNMMTRAANHLRNMIGAFQLESGSEYQAQILSSEMIMGILSGNAGNFDQAVGEQTAPQLGPQGGYTYPQGGTSAGQNGNGGARNAGQNYSNQASMLSSELLNYRGEVVAYEYGTLTLLTDEGVSLGISTGNQNYSLSIGFLPQIGDIVLVTGYIGPEGLVSAATITIENTGEIFTFRSTAGRPNWAGGNGKGGGQH